MNVPYEKPAVRIHDKTRCFHLIGQILKKMKEVVIISLTCALVNRTKKTKS